jgi:hypothetical protein
MPLARACLLALILSCPLAAFGQSQKFDVAQVAEGVYAVVRRDAPGYAVESNSVSIVCDEDVIVVDAQSNAAAFQLPSAPPLRPSASLR